MYIQIKNRIYSNIYLSLKYGICDMCIFSMCYKLFSQIYFSVKIICKSILNFILNYILIPANFIQNYLALRFSINIILTLPIRQYAIFQHEPSFSPSF